MSIKSSEPIDIFSSQVDEVKKLPVFDQDILNLVISSLESLSSNLKGAGIDNPYLLPERTIDIIKNIKTHGSLKQRYETINNHSVVLLVSYFASTIGELFNSTIDHIVLNSLELPKKLQKEELKFSISDLQRHNYDLNHKIGRMIAKKATFLFRTCKAYQGHLVIF